MVISLLCELNLRALQGSYFLYGEGQGLVRALHRIHTGVTILVPNQMTVLIISAFPLRWY